MEELEFNVSHLLREPVGATDEVEICVDRDFDLDAFTTNHLRGHAQLMHTNFGILVRANLFAQTSLACDRCLEKYDAQLTASFAEEFLPVVDVATGRPVQSERTEETFFLTPNHVVDMTEAVRQHLLISMPMHQLCDEECRGLCPQCGANLNVNPCSCDRDEESSFSALADLLRNG
jgi:uncharacterized protein